MSQQITKSKSIPMEHSWQLESESRQILSYLDQFQYLKTDIDELMQAKTPFGFLWKIRKIFSKLDLYLRKTSEFINSSLVFVEDKNEIHSFLYDLWINLEYYKTIYIPYLQKIKFFDHVMYFQIYAIFDTEFISYIQCIRRIKRKENIFHQDIWDFELLDSRYYRFYKFNKLLKKIEINILKWLWEDSELSFFNHLVFYLYQHNSRREEKIWFLKELFEIFSLWEMFSANLTFNKIIQLETIIGSDDGYIYEIWKIKEWIEHWKIKTTIKNYDYSYSSFVDICDLINHENSTMSKEENGTIQRYLWEYFKNSIKNQLFQGKNIFEIATKNKMPTKQDWLEKKIHIDFDSINTPSASRSSSLQFIKTLNDYKLLILKLENSWISDLMKWPILTFLSENLSIRKEDTNKIQFLLYYLVCDNYKEYQKVYLFIHELEVFEELKRWEKVKIYAFVIIMGLIIIICVSYWISLFLAFWLLLFYQWFLFSKTNETAKREYIRWHLWCKIIGTMTLFFYIILGLISCHILTFDVKIWNKTISMEILESKEVKNIAYLKFKDTNIWVIISDVIQSVLHKKDE